MKSKLSSTSFKIEPISAPPFTLFQDVSIPSNKSCLSLGFEPLITSKYSVLDPLLPVVPNPWHLC